MGRVGGNLTINFEEVIFPSKEIVNNILIHVILLNDYLLHFLITDTLKPHLIPSHNVCIIITCNLWSFKKMSLTKSWEFRKLMSKDLRTTHWMMKKVTQICYSRNRNLIKPWRLISFRNFLLLKMSSIEIKLINTTTNINPWPHPNSC